MPQLLSSSPRRPRVLITVQTSKSVVCIMVVSLPWIERAMTRVLLVVVAILSVALAAVGTAAFINMRGSNSAGVSLPTSDEQAKTAKQPPNVSGGADQSSNLTSELKPFLAPMVKQIGAYCINIPADKSFLSPDEKLVFPDELSGVPSFIKAGLISVEKISDLYGIQGSYKTKFIGKVDGLNIIMKDGGPCLVIYDTSLTQLSIIKTEKVVGGSTKWPGIIVYANINGLKTRAQVGVVFGGDSPSLTSNFRALLREDAFDDSLWHFVTWDESSPDGSFESSNVSDELRKD